MRDTGSRTSGRARRSPSPAPKGSGCRELIHLNVTDHPTAVWTARQLIEAFPEETAPKYLLRARDAIYGEAFIRYVDTMGILDSVEKVARDVLGLEGRLSGTPSCRLSEKRSTRHGRRRMASAWRTRSRTNGSSTRRSSSVAPPPPAAPAGALEGERLRDTAVAPTAGPASFQHLVLEPAVALHEGEPLHVGDVALQLADGVLRDANGFCDRAPRSWLPAFRTWLPPAGA